MGRVGLEIKARYIDINGQAERAGRKQNYFGIQAAFPKYIVPLSSPCLPESEYLGWNLSLGMLPDPITRYHFLNKGLPMTRVHGHVHKDKIVHDIQ